MAWEATADPDRFDEAVEWFSSRFPVTKELLAALGAYAGPRAWTISGVAQLDIILSVFAALEKAIETGQTLSEFKAAVKTQLEGAWGGPKAGRIELIFRNAAQSSYNAGRHRQMREVTNLRPYWMFDAILDSRTTPTCSARNGIVLSSGDPYWQGNWPPLHHNCRSSVRALTEGAAKRRGITTNPPEDQPSDGFGKSPDQEPWRPNPNDYPTDLWEIYEQKQASRASE